MLQKSSFHVRARKDSGFSQTTNTPTLETSTSSLSVYNNNNLS